MSRSTEPVILSDEEQRSIRKYNVDDVFQTGMLITEATSKPFAVIRLLYLIARHNAARKQKNPEKQSWIWTFSKDILLPSSKESRIHDYAEKTASSFSPALSTPLTFATFAGLHCLSVIDTVLPLYQEAQLLYKNLIATMEMETSERDITLASLQKLYDQADDFLPTDALRNKPYNNKKATLHHACQILTCHLRIILGKNRFTIWFLESVRPPSSGTPTAKTTAKSPPKA